MNSSALRDKERLNSMFLPRSWPRPSRPLSIASVHSAAMDIPRPWPSGFARASFSVATIVVNPPPTPGAVPRDSNDDMIIACAVAASAEYLVTRDHDLLSLGTYREIAIINPEQFLHILREQFSRLPN